MSDNPALYDWMNVGEIGWFAASFYPDGFLANYHESIRRYEIPDDRKIAHLSKGQRAKVALSLAIAHDPELLILDEPTSGLDPMVRRDFLESMSLRRCRSNREKSIWANSPRGCSGCWGCGSRAGCCRW